MWAASRKEFVTRVELKNLKGDLLGETENPAAYIHRLRESWKEITNDGPEITTLPAVVKKDFR